MFETTQEVMSPRFHTIMNAIYGLHPDDRDACRIAARGALEGGIGIPPGKLREKLADKGICYRVSGRLKPIALQHFC